MVKFLYHYAIFLAILRQKIYISQGSRLITQNLEKSFIIIEEKKVIKWLNGFNFVSLKLL